MLPLQSLAEFFFVTVRKKKLSQQEAQSAVQTWLDVFPVVAASHHGLTSAIVTVRLHQIAFWDAMLVATAEEAGCDLLVSEDFQNGRRIGRVTIVNPFGPEMPPLLREALRLP